MRIYMATDMEGTAGIINFEDWAKRDGRYYDAGKVLTTEEVNACIRGFYDACDENGVKIEAFLVVDGHGPGALNHLLLDARVQYARGWSSPVYPLYLDRGYDVVAVVGQHAMAGAEYAHLPHTQGFDYLCAKFNGIECGEYGNTVLTAGELGIPVIYASGDQAFTKEAEALTPWTVTTTVKYGTMPGKGDECDHDAYRKRNISAIHESPQKARTLIYQDSKRAMEMYIANKNSFKPLKLEPPIVYERWFRKDKDKDERYIVRKSDVSVADVLNQW